MLTPKMARAGASRGLLLIVLAAVLWGTVGVSTQAIYGLADTTPLSIAFLRLMLSLPALVLASAVLLGRRALRVSRRHLGLMLLIGLMLALYQVCFFAAIPLVGVAVATLVTLCSAPIIVALLSATLLRERLTGRLLLALGCAVAGTGLLVDLSPVGAGRPLAAAGVLLALGSAFGYALVALCSRALAGWYHPLQPVTIGFGVGAAVLLPIAGMNGLQLAYPAAGWALLVYLGIVPSALAYSLFFLGMRHTSATAASIVTLIEPLTAASLAWVLFGERLGPLGAVGAVLLLGAVVLLSSGGKRPAAEGGVLGPGMRPYRRGAEPDTGSG